MELFAKLVNGRQPSTIFTKRSILDVRLGSECASVGNRFLFSIVRYLVQNGFLNDLLGSQYLFESSQTSVFVKNSDNVVKNGCFEKRMR